jgi:hypothetical protein
MQRLAQGGHILFEVIFVHNAQALSSHGSPSLARGEHSSDALREGIDIARGNHASIYAIVNQIFLASHLAGHDHRSARIHHLVNRLPQRLIDRCQYEYIAQIVEAWQL